MNKKYTNMLLKMATNRLNRDFDIFAKSYGLTGMQMSIIDFVSRQGAHEVFQRDIEEEFYIRRSTASVLLQRMEKAELLYRKSSTVDARQKSVYLTDKSKNIEREIADFMKHNQDTLENNFSKEDIQTFEKMLKFYIAGGES